MPHRPHPPQAAALLVPARELLYGGAAGGGKSDYLLMAALQHVDEPRYAALLLRRTYPELAMPGAIMDRATEWLRPYRASGEVHWDDSEHTFTFPSGATLTFGYLQSRDDHLRYQSAEFQFIGFDELTAFKEEQYRFLFSRLRRLEGSRIPLRMRAASNPGGPGHEWVKQRFIVEGRGAGRTFIPARLADNPSLDYDEYLASLSELDPVTRARLLAGDWDARQGGGFFRREWFLDRMVADIPVDDPVVASVRYWDFAATPPTGTNDPDYTVGVRMGRLRGGRVVIQDVQRMRGTPNDVEALVLRTAAADGPRVKVLLEQEPGSAGVTVVNYYSRRLMGYPVRAVRPDKKKEIRAAPYASAVQAGHVLMLPGRWLGAFLDEHEAFDPETGSHGHDDQVDAAAGAFAGLVQASAKLVTW